MATRRGFLFACAGVAACGCGETTNKPPVTGEVCTSCNGSGRFVGPCAVCRGSGQRVSGVQNPVSCTSCGGTGSASIECRTCSGTGRKIKYK